MKVVEEPFRGGGHELAVVHVLGKRPVGRAQRAGIVVEARKDAAGAPAPRGIDGESRGQRQRALFEPLDAEQLLAKRFQSVGRRAGPGRCEQSCLRFVLW
jgi:hypothetical protein